MMPRPPSPCFPPDPTTPPPGSLTYYCNGRVVARWDDPRVSSVPGYVMFTLPSGGWDNDDVDDKTLPADLIIDYVRVWQRTDLAALPTMAPGTPAGK
jgi:beta-glucanase (GH16 family)